MIDMSRYCLLFLFTYLFSCFFCFCFCFRISCGFICCCCFPFLVVVGFELSTLCLLGKCSITQVKPPAPFCFSYFSDRMLDFYLGCPQTSILLISVSQVAGIRCMNHATSPPSAYFLIKQSKSVH
jgi:hypothetical protein